MCASPRREENVGQAPVAYIEVALSKCFLVGGLGTVGGRKNDCSIVCRGTISSMRKKSEGRRSLMSGLKEKNHSLYGQSGPPYSPIRFRPFCSCNTRAEMKLLSCRV